MGYYLLKVNIKHTIISCKNVLWCLCWCIWIYVFTHWPRTVSKISSKLTMLLMFFSFVFFFLLNPFHAPDLFWYPLETSENQRFFCFQGASKKISGMKWVKKILVLQRSYCCLVLVSATALKDHATFMEIWNTNLIISWKYLKGKKKIFVLYVCHKYSRVLPHKAWPM